MWVGRGEASAFLSERARAREGGTNAGARMQGKSEGEGEEKKERGREDYEYGGLIEKRKKNAIIHMLSPSH